MLSTTAPQIPGCHDRSTRGWQATDLPALADLVDRVRLAGEFPGWSQAELAAWVERLSFDPDGTVVALCDGKVVGLITPRYELMAVDPAVRRMGIGTLLLEAGEWLAAERGELPLLLAPPVGSSCAEPFLRANGYLFHHNLWRMIYTGDTPEAPQAPDDLRERRYGAADLVDYVGLMNAAFADHPSPWEVSVEMIAKAQSGPDFDPSDIGLLSGDGLLVAFCRTAVETDDAGKDFGHIRVLGVRPGWRGRGLGRWAVRWGVTHLRTKTAGEIVLEVEGVNEKALALYSSEGFVQTNAWPRWSRG